MDRRAKTKDRVRKIVALIAIAALVLNMILFAVLRYNSLVFWVVLLVIIIIVFPILKKFKEEQK
jgi:hypothetical protein